MGLVMSPFYFNHCTDNLTGTPTTPSMGTTFTAGASNADGSAVGVLSALTHDVNYLVFAVSGTNVINVDNRMLMSILIDPAGGTSWSTLIPTLLVGGQVASAEGEYVHHLWFHFPIWIRAGASVGVQARSSFATPPSSRISMWAYGSPSNPAQWWCGTGVEALGINASTSTGTSITAGNSGAFGSWTDIGASTANYGAVQFSFNVPNNATAIQYHYEIGYASQKLPGSPTFYASRSSSEFYTPRFVNTPIFCDVPSGTTWQIRGTASGTAQAKEVGIYGVY